MQIDTQLLVLLCGHFVGDFVLQTDGLVERKARYPKWMLCHVLLVAIVTWVLLGNLRAWWIVGILLLLHLLVDCIKLWGVGKTNDRSGKSDNGINRDFLWFVGDQILHILSIVILWMGLGELGAASSLTNYWAALWGAGFTKGLLLVAGLTVGVWGMEIILRCQMAEFAARMPGREKQGLPKGGQTIGKLERLLVFMFVLAGKPEGIGFVIAAKSVFRIGELTNKGDRDHAEYIMIGTLRSFTYALVIAFMTQWLIGQIS